MKTKLTSINLLISGLLCMGIIVLFAAYQFGQVDLGDLLSFDRGENVPVMAELDGPDSVGNVEILDTLADTDSTFQLASAESDAVMVQTAAIREAVAMMAGPPCDVINCATTGMPFTVVTSTSGPALEALVVSGVNSSNWKTVTTANVYTNMVVVCSVQYMNNIIPEVIRMRNAATNSFEIRLQNPSGTVLSSETVHCIIAEEGEWELDDGRKLEAKKYLSTVTDRTGFWLGQQQTYGNFYSNPVVFGQVMTYNDTSWSTFWSRGNTPNSPPSSNAIYTGKHIGQDSTTQRNDETIGFIVFESGRGIVQNIEYEVNLGLDNSEGLDNGTGYTNNFIQNFSTPPQFGLISLAAMDGGDGGWGYLFGASPISISGVNTIIDEDQIIDSERWHTDEQVGFAVFSQASIFDLAPPSSSDLVMGEVGLIDNTLTDLPQTIILDKSYSNPVVFVQAPSYDGGDQSITRITNIQSDRFTVYIQEAPNLDGGHTNESVSYIVIEEGVWQLANGTKIQVGKFDTDATVGIGPGNSQWVQVNLSAFATPPSVVSQVQTNNDPHWVKTRMVNVNANQFYVSMQEDESQTLAHGTETIGWIAIEQSLGIWNGHQYEAYSIPSAVTHNWYQLNFNNSYTMPPYVVNSISSFFGGDSAHLRYSRLSLTPSGIQLRVEEDTSFDSEIGHGAETVDYIAVEGDGFLTASPLVTAANYENPVKVSLDLADNQGIDDSEMFSTADFNYLLIGDDEEDVVRSNQDVKIWLPFINQ